MGVASVVDRARGWIARMRLRHGSVDLLVRALGRYAAADATQLAASVTYYGFLSFFPLLAVAFAAVGIVITVVPNAGQLVTDALGNFLPGLVGAGSGQINARQIAAAKAGVGVVGFLALLYSASGMASSMRSALAHMFAVPPREQRNFAVAKVFDLATIAVVGVIMVVSVSLSAAVTSQAGRLLRVLGIEHSPLLRVLLSALGVLLGVAASSLMLFVLYRVLPDSHLPSRNLWAGALVAAIGLELLKLLATFVIARVTSNPLYGTFAVVVALLVWINYFARLAMLGAAVAVTRNRLTDRDLAASEAFAARAGQLARTPIGGRKLGSRLLAAIMLLVLVGRRSVQPGGRDERSSVGRGEVRRG